METLLIALVSGAGGAVITALFQRSHQRSQDIRDRMLSTADEFTIALRQAMMRSGNVANLAEESMIMNRSIERVSDALVEARRAIDEAEVQGARVTLNFGASSTASQAATAAVRSLRAFISDFDDWPPTSQEGAGYKEAHDAFHTFNREARLDIDRYGALAFRTSLRQLKH